MSNHARNISVVQLGARMHYAVPSILQRAGWLQYFYTDICATKGLPRALHYIPQRLLPASLRRLLARVPGSIPQERIVAFTNFGLDYAYKLHHSRTESAATAVHLWAGERINDLVLAHWHPATKIVYGYNSACEKLFMSLSTSGVIRIIEQTIAPKASELAILASEQDFISECHSQNHDDYVDEYIDREKHEWALADRIICGSEFVRNEVIAQGGDESKCVVVPYGVQLPQHFSLAGDKQGPGLLRVLFVGSVSVRKGVRYLLDAMRRLKGHNVICRVVGPISIPRDVLQRYTTANVQIVGPIPRSEISREFAQADVFCLPSLCEGSATVIYEALAHGLPVVTTANAGSIVRDGIDGYIIPLRDSEVLAEKLDYLATHRALLTAMSAQALQRSRDGSFDAYASRLLSLVSQFQN